MAASNFKVGDKVRVNNVKKIALGSLHFDNGDITTVESVEPTMNMIYLKSVKRDSPLKILPYELRFVENLSQIKSETLGEVLAELAKVNEKLDRILSAQSKPEPIAIDSKIVARQLLQPEPVKNSARMNSIKSAQTLLAELMKYNGSSGFDGFNGVKHGLYIVRPHFDVDFDARKVTVELRGVSSGKVRGEAIAKCHPDDTFNVVIGKAIALARALGHGLPPELTYELAQPDEAVKGAVVQTVGGKSVKVHAMRPTHRTYNSSPEHYERFMNAKNGFTSIISIDKSKYEYWRGINSIDRIIDDSNAKYGKGE